MSLLSRSEEKLLLEQTVAVAEKFVETARSRKISVKLRKLLKYAYISYTMNIDPHSPEGWRRIMTLAARVKTPSQLMNHYFYRRMEQALLNSFNARIMKRRHAKYIVFYKRRPVAAEQKYYF